MPAPALSWPRGGLRLVLPEHLDTPPAVGEILAELPHVRAGEALNFYDEAASQSQGDLPGEAAERLGLLRRYLAARWEAPLVLVGEAPGYQGARRSGIAFTSQHQLTGSGWKEPSATIVHRTLAELGAEERVLLWNTCVLHPFHPGLPDSNRAPTAEELAASIPLLERVCAGREVVAVGKVAQAATGGPYVRHPANGGARAFAEGLAELLARLP